MRKVVLLPVALALLAPAPAYAVHKEETAALGSVTATLSYDYSQTRSTLESFQNVRVTVDREGRRLVDQALGDECRYCAPWPAAFGAMGTQSIDVRDLDADGEPEVLVNLYSGGANCCFYTDSWRYDAEQDKYVFGLLRPGLSFPYTLKDLNRDGVPEFVSIDYRFAYKYGSNADTPRPLRIFDWNDGGLLDVTIGYPKRAARDASSLYRVYLHFRKQKDANLRGVLAAYLADSYNAGNGRIAWRRVVAAYRRGELDKKAAFESGPFGKRYLTSLRSLLARLGYLHRA